MEKINKYLDDFNDENMPLIHTPSLIIPVGVITFYVSVVVYLIPLMMQKRNPPMKLLNKINEIWNFLLFVFSVVVHVCGVAVIVHTIWEGGFHVLLCDSRGLFWKGKSLFICWTFFISKLVELGDTLWLALRKRPIIFLHWYHHTTVLFFGWYSLRKHYQLTIIFGMMNSCIHAFMYYYYWRAAQNHKLQWGPYLTIAQTVQMFIGLVLTFIWTYFYFFDVLESPTCISHDPYLNLLSAMIMYASYFVLFLRFYFSKNSGDSKKGV